MDVAVPASAPTRKGLAERARPFALSAAAAAAPLAGAAAHSVPVAAALAAVGAVSAWAVLHQLERHRAAARRIQEAAEVTGVRAAVDGFLRMADAQLVAARPGACAVAVIRVESFDQLLALDGEAAEQALELLAERLVGAVGDDEPLVRLGGPSFGVFLRCPEGLDALGRRARALSYTLSQGVRLSTLSFIPELKTGVAAFQGEGENAQALLRRAEASVAEARSAAEEPVHFYSRNQREAALERFTLKQELRNAINREEFELHYQPVVDLSQGRVTSAEALLRWRRPDGALMPPGRFVPLLEESAMMEEVGLWILNTACRQLRLWTADGVPELRVAVNLSVRQFRNPKLAEVVARTLDLHGIAPRQLEVELTETAAMQDAKRTALTLGELKALGVSVAIDDFGSGYSSLSYLRTLPFSKLKIDREFVTDVDHRPESRAICKAVIELARGLNMSVLAEGVERLEEVDTLSGLGCPKFQGFYFSRPLEPAAFAARIKEPQWLDRLASPVHRRLADLQARLA